MAQTRDENKPQSSPTTSAFIATFVTQPIRSWLSRAQNNFSPLTTIVDSWKSDGWRLITKGLPINLARGTFSTATAAYAKQWAGYHVQDSHPWLAIATMLTASSFAEMSVAYAFETWFIRRINLDANNMLRGVKYSTFNFAPVLAPLYFVRGVGFGTIVFYSNHLPPAQQNALLVTGTIFSATAQKFISGVATGDLMRHEGTVPDFKEGVRATFRNVLRGDVYTHPSYRGYYMNPTSLTKQVANVLYVGCNPAMFTFRLGYLFVVRYAFNEAEKNSAAIQSKLRFFARAGNEKSYLLMDSERELLKDTGDYFSVCKRS